MKAWHAPAFPAANNDHYEEGMDLRTYVATAALQGILSQLQGPRSVKLLAEDAVACADALLSELREEPI